jgi:hypothetical protein
MKKLPVMSTLQLLMPPFQKTRLCRFSATNVFCDDLKRQFWGCCVCWAYTQTYDPTPTTKSWWHIRAKTELSCPNFLLERVSLVSIENRGRNCISCACGGCQSWNQAPFCTLYFSTFPLCAHFRNLSCWKIRVILLNQFHLIWCRLWWCSPAVQLRAPQCWTCTCTFFFTQHLNAKLWQVHAKLWAFHRACFWIWNFCQMTSANLLGAECRILQTCLHNMPPYVLHLHATQDDVKMADAANFMQKVVNCCTRAWCSMGEGKAASSALETGILPPSLRAGVLPPSFRRIGFATRMQRLNIF